MTSQALEERARENVRVIKADRIAAWPVRPVAYRDGAFSTHEVWMGGGYDSDPFIQAFASHRLAFAVQQSERGDQETIAAAILGMPIEKFRVWAANGTTYPNSYEGDVERTWQRADRVLTALNSPAREPEGMVTVPYELCEVAFREAVRRYPEAISGLAWFAAASGLKAGEVTQEHIDWAKSATIAAAEAAPTGGEE